ncbi:class I SAM-dependent DNA methyltransferase [Enterococcus nangangensis]|uniref:class I SAM-dependent DNA methyltransferase n=1 Tax=Enterococcus nangangensis TaxID=2559926 RepID=UPI0010F5DC48|nr:class I SAM-dependent methyltransferase [Enterococcus nangangensis]
MNYETFASVYDTIMDDSLYEKWEEFTLKHLPQTTMEVLELACGTGDLALLLADKFQVSGLDLSEEMLAMADRKAQEADVSLNLIAGDMRDLKDIGHYDAVTCYSDSLCYLANAQDVQQTFDEVFQVLKEEGTFIFDVHSIYQVEEGFKDYSFHDQTEDFAFLWDSYPGDAPYSVEHYLTFFVKEGEEDLFLRKDELHQERTYPLPEYLRLLENAGFTRVEVFGDFTEDAPQEDTARWFFVAHKE